MNTPLVSLVSLLFIAAVTPGPNNFIILGLSLTKGSAATFLPIGAILLGSQLVLLMTDLGMHLILDALPGLQFILMGAGCVYLAWSGLKMILLRNTDQGFSYDNKSLLGLMMFQMINPKSWILVGTSYAAYKASVNMPPEQSPYWTLSLLVFLIPLCCLILWAGAGHLIYTHMNTQISKRYLTPVLGTALIFSAAGLLGLAWDNG